MKIYQHPATEDLMKLFVCECHSTDHQFIFVMDPDDEWDECYLEVHLSNLGTWYRRLWRKLQYLFGRRSRFGAWDEVIVKKTDAVRIRDLMQRFIDVREERKRILEETDGTR